jgi:hypothetical protein
VLFSDLCLAFLKKQKKRIGKNCQNEEKSNKQVEIETFKKQLTPTL